MTDPSKKGTKMPKLSVGMAILITPENIEKLSIVNGGVVPKETGVYFYFPYDYNAACRIYNRATFAAKFKFANTQNPNYFVDVDEI